MIFSLSTAWFSRNLMIESPIKLPSSVSHWPIFSISLASGVERAISFSLSCSLKVTVSAATNCNPWLRSIFTKAISNPSPLVPVITPI